MGGGGGGGGRSGRERTRPYISRSGRSINKPVGLMALDRRHNRRHDRHMQQSQGTQQQSSESPTETVAGLVHSLLKLCSPVS